MASGAAIQSLECKRLVDKVLGEVCVLKMPQRDGNRQRPSSIRVRVYERDDKKQQDSLRTYAR